MFWSRDSQPSTRITLTQIRYHSKNPRSTITVRFQERILTNVYNSESTIILEMWVYYNSAIWRCLILRVSVKWPFLNAQFLAEQTKTSNFAQNHAMIFWHYNHQGFVYRCQIEQRPFRWLRLALFIVHCSVPAERKPPPLANMHLHSTFLNQLLLIQSFLKLMSKVGN